MADYRSQWEVVKGRIRVVIADDEPAGRRAVQLLLTTDSAIQIVGQCRSGSETVDVVLETRPDILFLDVQMPGGDGFTVLSQIPPDLMPLVVFVTAFDEYAIQAFDVHAADYLLKPFTDRRFRAAVARVKERLRQRTAADAERLSTLLHRLGTARAERRGDAGAPPHSDRVSVRTAQGTLLLDVEEIDWIEARGDYVRIHSAGRADVLREAIGRMEERLGTGRFVRIHRSALVNLSKVREIRTPAAGESVAVLDNGTRCKLSRSGRERLARALGHEL